MLSASSIRSGIVTVSGGVSMIPFDGGGAGAGGHSTIPADADAAKAIINAQTILSCRSFLMVFS
jgi:hypothetical protein